MKRNFNLIIAVLFLIIAFLLGWEWQVERMWSWMTLCVVLALIHLVIVAKEVSNGQKIKQEMILQKMPESALTELILLGEDDNRLASWNIYGQNGIVIGRDVMENNVTINLNDCEFSSMIESEHCVLNFTGDHWYIEDISEKNGVSIRKSDGRKYHLAYGKPCRLEHGDIIYIALTRLQIL